MDAKTMYRLMKPHLDLMNLSEKQALSKLINALPPSKNTCQHKKILSLSKAKENLKKVCLREMERERQKQFS